MTYVPQAAIDHGSIGGLADDDHTQYATDSDLTTHAGAADPHTGYLLESLLDAKGDLVAASADNTPAKVTAGANGTVLTADSGQAAGVKWDARIESHGGTILNPSSGQNVIVWRAAYACTVTNVRAKCKGGTSVTFNARRNGASNHLASAGTASAGDATTDFTDGGSVQNTAYAAGDRLEIMAVTVTGSVTEYAVIVDFSRP